LNIRLGSDDVNTADISFVVSVFTFGLAFLCLWSVGTQIASLSALPFATLYPIFIAALVASAGICRLKVAPIFDSSRLQIPSISIRPSAIKDAGILPIATVVVLTLAFVAAGAIQYKTSNFFPLWGLGLVAALLALLLGPRAGASGVISLGQPAENSPTPYASLTFVLVALILLIFYFFTSVPDADDSLFLNFAVGAIQQRDALFATDTMLGIPELIFLKSTYRLETYQLLAALISDVTGLSVIIAAHAVLPAFILVWAASVFVLLHRAIFRSYFLVTIVFHLAVLIAVDGALQSYGYHAIPRFFQGKGPFVTLMVPLIAVLTVSALRDNRWMSVILLAAAVVVSIGFTANAIYAGPFAAALVAIPFLFGLAGTRLRPFRLILVVIYPAILAGFLLAFDPPPSDMHPSEISGIADAIGPIGGVLWGLMGTPYMHVVALGLIFLAAISAFANTAMRPVSIYAMGLLLFVMNPFLWDIFNRSVTGGNNYRLLWAVPVPFVLAVIAGVLWGTRILAVRGLLLVALGVSMVAPGSIFYRAQTGFSLIKIPIPEYEIAKAVNGAAGSSDIILAPEEISAWIPTFDDARPVVESRGLYLVQRIGQFSPDQLSQRTALFQYWSSETPADLPDNLGDLIEALAVSVIVVNTQQPNHIAAFEIMLSLGFTENAKFGKYTVLKK